VTADNHYAASPVGVISCIAGLTAVAAASGKQFNFNQQLPGHSNLVNCADFFREQVEFYSYYLAACFSCAIRIGK